MGRIESATELRRAAMNLLARREHSGAELRAKLRARGAADAELGAVLERLAADGLQSDARYAESLARSHASRGKGPLRIAAELKARGVDDAVANAALRALDVSWGELAAAARRKRFGDALPATREDRAKQARFLEQRGFAAEHVREALGR
jgi:regulatory protein